MKKIQFTDNSGRWFDMDSAKEFRADSYTDSEGQVEVCRATGHWDIWETLYLTRKGTFVRVVSSDREEFQSVSEMEVETAIQWLISNGHQEEVKKIEYASEESRLEA